jgi:hypothetical protein
VRDKLYEGCCEPEKEHEKKEEKEVVLLKVTTIAHVLFGALTALVSIVQPVLSIINTMLYIMYQLDQEWHLRDEAYDEILEFAVGLAIGETFVLLLSF